MIKYSFEQKKALVTAYLYFFAGDRHWMSVLVQFTLLFDKPF